MIPADLQQYVFVIIALCLDGKSACQFIKTYKGDFILKFDISATNNQSKGKFIKNMALAGFFARGFTVGIVAYFLIKGGLSLGRSTGELKGTYSAFSFLLQNS